MSITIPPEVIDAAVNAYAGAIWDADSRLLDYRHAMTAACLAMLEAWPMWTINETNVPGGYLPAIILPLTENPDAEA